MTAVALLLRIEWVYADSSAVKCMFCHRLIWDSYHQPTHVVGCELADVIGAKTTKGLVPKDGGAEIPPLTT